MRITGMILADHYNIPVKSASYHVDGNWFWNLQEFPAALFDARGCVMFKAEEDYYGCVWLSIGPQNTGVRGKHVGMSIADIPGYQKLAPPPSTLTLE